MAPRDGGASYTAGYLTDGPRTVLVDTRRLDRVEEINTADMHVVVEAGCTWQALAEALGRHAAASRYFRHYGIDLTGLSLSFTPPARG